MLGRRRQRNTMSIETIDELLKDGVFRIEVNYLFFLRPLNQVLKLQQNIINANQ